MNRIAAFFFCGCLLFALGCASEDDQTAAMAEAHATDTPQASGFPMEPAQPVTASSVTYAEIDGADVTGYLARPANVSADDALPGVIVIHEWWGLNDNIRAMTEKLAGEGYQALAVDLYGGTVADTRDGARAAMSKALENMDAARANLSAAYSYLVEQGGAPSVASIGWCFGGGMSLQTALALPGELDGAIIYYGSVNVPEEQLAAITAPVLGLFGSQDQGIPPASVEQFEQRMMAQGKTVEIHMFDADHAFSNPSGQNYNEEAAAAAWAETTEFLGEVLE